MRVFRLVITYDGARYHGWQIQPNGHSVQQELTNAIEKVTGQAVAPVASGRTDTGVHALAQVASLQLETRLDANTLRRAINSQLPEDITLTEVSDAPPDFNAIRDAKWKLYRYVFHDGPNWDVFLRGRCWKVHGRLDVDRMALASQILVGTHDFACFETEWPNRKSSVRTVTRCHPVRLGDLVYLDMEANGFLYNMVRAVAGTLREIGRGKWPVEKMTEILENADRRLAGPNAPACGLFLVRVTYTDFAGAR